MSQLFGIHGDTLVFLGESPRTLRDAWDITIQKWQALVQAPVTYNGGSHTCGLCMYFRRWCKPCPIGKDMGQEGCDGTPYGAYNWEPTSEHAQAELDYLLDLRKRTGG